MPWYGNPVSIRDIGGLNGDKIVGMNHSTPELQAKAVDKALELAQIERKNSKYVTAIMEGAVPGTFSKNAKYTDSPLYYNELMEAYYSGNAILNGDFGKNTLLTNIIFEFTLGKVGMKDVENRVGNIRNNKLHPYHDFFTKFDQAGIETRILGFSVNSAMGFNNEVLGKGANFLNNEIEYFLTQLAYNNSDEMSILADYRRLFHLNKTVTLDQLISKTYDGIKENRILNNKVADNIVSTTPFKASRQSTRLIIIEGRLHLKDFKGKDMEKMLIGFASSEIFLPAVDSLNQMKNTEAQDVYIYRDGIEGGKYGGARVVNSKAFGKGKWNVPSKGTDAFIHFYNTDFDKK